MSLRKDQPHLLYDSEIERTCSRLKKEAREFKEKLKMANEKRQREIDAVVVVVRTVWEAERRAEAEAKEAQFWENQ